MSVRIADVLIPLALDTAYSYAVPSELVLVEGDVVQVPLGTREVAGVVWAVRDGPGSNFKRVTGRIDAPTLPPTMRKFLDWVARYTLAPRGSVLAMGLKLAEEGRAEVTRIGVRLAGEAPKRLTPARTRVLEATQGGLVHLKRDLAKAAAVSVGVIDGLIDEGTLETVALAPEPVAERPDPDAGSTLLSNDQQAAAEALVATLTEGNTAVTLLEGVTGSGKTEVYFEAVAEALRQDRQVLILMPEIALTAQFLDRFAARFGVRPAAWHSGVSGRRRERLYAGVASAEVR
jgi:primosomal protein N' (replication factor Y)